MKLKGIDISHHNAKDTIEKNIHNTDFVIMKTTEGKTWVDPALELHNQKCDYYGILKGFYHFARPDLGNSPAEEARNFKYQVSDKGDSILALDIEGAALHVKNIDEWALEWLELVEATTKRKPLLYASRSELWRFPKVAANNNGLWVARYNLYLGKVKPWKFAAMWQYSSNPIDKNYFYGTENQFLKYAKGANS